MSKKSSSGSALSVLAIRWLSTAWLLLWLSRRPGRLPPAAAADGSSNRRPCAPETLADSDNATQLERRNAAEESHFFGDEKQVNRLRESDDYEEGLRCAHIS